MIFQAHKGVSIEFPENTMPAYIAAIGQGYEIIELDVSVTKDMQFVMLHDSKLNRTARNQDGSELESEIRIADITYEEALQYEYGSWRFPEWKGTKIPLFKEVLELAAKHEVELKIDNKYQKFTVEQRSAFYELLKPYQDFACLTCKNVEGIVEAMQELPDMRFHYDGLVTKEILDELATVLPKERLTIWGAYQNEKTTWVKVPFVDKEMASMIKEYGRLGIWILSKEEELKDAKEMGADIIETNGQLKPDKSKVLVEGHRGYAAKYPENTLVSFEAAMDLGVDAVEFDVWLTKDKVPVIMHDGNGKRTCGTDVHVRDLTLEEVKSLEASYELKFGDEFKGKGCRIPTLKELLELRKAKRPDLMLGVEIKEYTEETVDVTVAMLKEYGVFEQCYFYAFNARIIQYIKEKYDGRTMGYPDFQMPEFKEDSYSYYYDIGLSLRYVKSEIFPIYEAKNLPMHMYCADTTEDVILCIEKGAALITANDPVPLMKVLGRIQ